jgi:hypothetical protein
LHGTEYKTRLRQLQRLEGDQKPLLLITETPLRSVLAKGI